MSQHLPLAVPRFYPIKLHIFSIYFLQKDVYLSRSFLLQFYFLNFEDYFAGLSFCGKLCWDFSNLQSRNNLTPELWCGTPEGGLMLLLLCVQEALGYEKVDV